MKRRRSVGRATAIILGVCWGLGVAATVGAADPQMDIDKDVSAVKRFLAAKYPDKQWQQGPAPMKNAAIEKAYAKLRFYYVFSSPQLVTTSNYISAMLRVEKEGNVVEMSGDDSYNTGLMGVQSTRDATLAAAAVMSLTFGPTGPVSISTSDVRVAREGAGWLCLATPGPPDQSGRRNPHAIEVHFSAGGVCTGVAHRYTGKTAL